MGAPYFPQFYLQFPNRTLLGLFLFYHFVPTPILTYFHWYVAALTP